MSVHGIRWIGRAYPPESPDVILLYFSLCGVMKEVAYEIKRVETLH
jgi:hypothetical protein